MSWLATYFLLLLMPIIISLVVYFQAYRIVREDMILENAEALKQVRMAIDNGLKDIRNFSSFVAFNQNLNLLIQEKDIKNINSQYYQVNSIMNELKSFKLQNKYAEDFYIYFRQVDSVLTSNGLYDSDFFFKYYQKGTFYRDIMTYEKWKAMMDAQYAGSYLAFDVKRPESGIKKKSVNFIYSLPIFGENQPKATFVIALSNQRFNDAAQAIGSANGAWGLILDRDNNILFSTVPLNGPFPVQYGAMAKDAELLYSKVNGGDVAISYNTSGVEDWKYVSVIPLQVFQEKVAYIKTLIVACIVFSILLGGVFAWFFSRRNYRPISELIRNLEKKFRPQSENEHNEYRFIQEAMNNTFNEKDAINERLRQQNIILRRSFLVKLLKGRFEDSSFISKALESYKLDFSVGGFAVILFGLSGSAGPGGNDMQETSGGKLEMAELVIANVAEGIVGQKNNGYAADVDGMLACIVNFRGSDTEENMRELCRAAAEIAFCVRNELGIDLSAAASDLHDSMFGIPDAYQEALCVMEYKAVMRTGDIMAYRQISVSSQGYNYSIETERQLINCIKSGDSKAADLCLNEIFEKNYSTTVLPAHMAKCLVFDVVGTIFKTVSETSVLREGTFIQDLDIARRLLNSDDFQEMKREMSATVEEICAYVQQHRKSKKDDLLDHVMEYIGCNYHDASLSVSQIADRFALTPAYLTRLFKEQSGEGLLDYITGLRMENAKQLLRNRKCSIKDVAARVGYYSSTAFIRMFKKTEGITPGSYMENG